MTKQRVTLYLDVDGVINAQMPPWESGDTREKVELDQTWSGTISFAQKMVDELATLDVDLVWTTTWEQFAPTVLAGVIGWEQAKHARWLEPKGLLKFGERNEYSLLWKSRAILRDQAETPSPFIWIDDELQDSYIKNTYQSTADVLALQQEHLVIGTKEFLGITPKQMESMKEFIAKMS